MSKLNLADKNLMDHIAYLEKYADHPSAFLTLNSETQRFMHADIRGFIAYRDDGRCLYQLCGVMAESGDQLPLLVAFMQHVKSLRRRTCCLQLRADQLKLYEGLGFTINQMGLSFSLDLGRFRTAGTQFMKVRNKIKRASKQGCVVREMGVDTPSAQKEWDSLRDITERWLQTKGNKLLQFMVGEIHPDTNDQRRVFAAFQHDRMIGYISYTRSYGEFAGWMHDLSRRDTKVPPGVMELINITAIKRFQDEGSAYLNFGFTPFCGISDEFDCLSSRSRTLQWLLLKLEKHGQRLYPALNQVSYKRKWQPQIETPEYVAFHGGFKWSYLFGILKITKSI